MAYRSDEYHIREALLRIIEAMRDLGGADNENLVAAEDHVKKIRVKRDPTKEKADAVDGE